MLKIPCSQTIFWLTWWKNIETYSWPSHDGRRRNAFWWMVWQKPRMCTLKTTSYKAPLTLMDNLAVKKKRKLDRNWVLSEMSLISSIQPNLSAIKTLSQAWRCWVELIYEVYKPTVTWLILIKKYWFKNNETFTGYTNRQAQQGLINLQTTVKPINQMPSQMKLVCQYIQLQSALHRTFR